jgi:hypothetical protein
MGTEDMAEEWARNLQANSISWTQQEVDWKKKMAEFNPQCAEKPLTYGLGAGIFLRGVLKHVKVPKDFPVIGGLMTAPDYSTGYQPITSKSSQSLFSSLFPPEICAADLCEGELPGCPPPHIVPVDIPRVIFKMSRPFHWAPDTPLALREFIAYGFAVLPEVVDVVARRINQGMDNTTTTTPPCVGSCPGITIPPTTKATTTKAAVTTTTAAATTTTATTTTVTTTTATTTARRLQEMGTEEMRPARMLEEIKLEEAQDGDHFDEIIVEFNDITYTIDHPLVHALIHNKAFDLLDDGRKRELGKINIIGFDVVPKVPIDTSPLQNLPVATASVTGMCSLLALLASVALVAIAFAKVPARKGSNEEEDPEEGADNMYQMQQMRDVSAADEPRYDRIRMHA